MPNLYASLPESFLATKSNYWIVDHASSTKTGGPWRNYFVSAEYVDEFYRSVCVQGSGLLYFRMTRVGTIKMVEREGKDGKVEQVYSGTIDLLQYSMDGKVCELDLTKIALNEYQAAIIRQLIHGERGHTAATIVRRAKKEILRTEGWGVDPDTDTSELDLKLGLVLADFRKTKLLPYRPVFLKTMKVVRGKDSEFDAVTYEIPDGMRDQQQGIKKMQDKGIAPSSWESAVAYTKHVPNSPTVWKCRGRKEFFIHLKTEAFGNMRALDLGIQGYFAKNIADAKKQAEADIERILDKLISAMQQRISEHDKRVS